MLNPPVSKRDHTIGPSNAEVVMVEYGDFECPYCAAAEPVFRALRETLSDSLLFAYRHFPLAEAHPHALHAAEAAEAAGAQGKFWEMHDAIYQQQSELGSDLLHQLAVKLKLNIEQFESDLDARRYRPRVKRDFMGGMRSGVASTPAFFINGKRYEGALDRASLMSAVGRA